MLSKLKEKDKILKIAQYKIKEVERNILIAKIKPKIEQKAVEQEIKIDEKSGRKAIDVFKQKRNRSVAAVGKTKTGEVKGLERSESVPNVIESKELKPKQLKE